MTILQRHLNRFSTIAAAEQQQEIETSIPATALSPKSPHTFPSPASHFSYFNNEDGDNSITRPSLYSHEPQPRRAPFEQYYGDHKNRIHLLEELKSNRLEGVYNLSFMLLAFALFYLFIKSIIDNGFLAGPSSICFGILLRDSTLLLCFVLPLPFCFIPPFCLIYLLSCRKISPRRVIIWHSCTLAGLLALLTAIIFRMELNPLLGVIAGVVVVILVLKMHSYVMTNLILAEETELIRKSKKMKRRKDSVSNNNNSNDNSNHLRKRHVPPTAAAAAAAAAATTTTTTTNTYSNDSDEASSQTTVDDDVETLPMENKKKDSTQSTNNSDQLTSPGVKYPLNVRISNIAYFIAAPTLVYETGYPRTSQIRPRYILWHTLQMVICLSVMYVLLMQFCVPVWRISSPTDKLWWFSMKLTLPCFFMWLLLFFSTFHCALNGISEITRFADRQFYKDWWNATDLNQFWKTWNIPVHEWCIRHLYLETVSRQRVMNRNAAALGTFLMSAVFHEYVCFVGFRMVRPYMFAGMILQVPFVKWSTKFAGTRTGNYFMWIMLFVGQSWVPLLYCRDYLSVYDTLMCRPLYSRQ